MDERQGQAVVDRSLTVDLTRLALAEVAPDEIPVFEESVAEYFADPASTLRAGEGDTPLGSGIDVAMMTPYLLSAVNAVLCRSSEPSSPTSGRTS